jgi:hypothetical protein
VLREELSWGDLPPANGVKVSPKGAQGLHKRDSYLDEVAGR